MASAAGRRTTVVLRGVDRSYYDVMSLNDLIEAGSLESIFAGDIVLGTSLCSQLGAYGIGTEIELYALNRKPISSLLPLSGISHMTTHLGGAINGNNEISSSLAIAELERVQQLLNYTTPVFLPGEFQGRGSLVACRLWGRTESDTTKVTQQQQ